MSADRNDISLVVKPLADEADMDGTLVEPTQIAKNSIPWDRYFSGTRRYIAGDLSYRSLTLMDILEQTQIFVNSLEPRGFLGTQNFIETTISAVEVPLPCYPPHTWPPEPETSNHSGNILAVKNLQV